MRKPTVSVDEFIESAQVAILSAIDDGEIKGVLSGFGYSEAKLNAGKTLLEEAKDLISAQKQHYGGQFGATDELNKAWEKANVGYVRALKVARVAFQDDVDAQGSLILHGERKKSLSGWQKQAKIFYDNLLNDRTKLAKMSEFGYTTEKLNSELGEVKQIALKDVKQTQGKGDAQLSTGVKDKKLDELGKWYSDFRAICKVAFADNPQNLEKLGIQVLNAPRRSKDKPESTTPADVN